MPTAEEFQGAGYRARVAAETGIYKDCVDVQERPLVFHQQRYAKWEITGEPEVRRVSRGGFSSWR